MKVRVRSARVDDVKRRGRVCPCCSRINFKCKVVDRLALKEALEEINGEAVVTG